MTFPLTRLAQFFTLWLVAAITSAGADRALVIRTDDGFALGLGEDGRVNVLQLDANNLPLAPQPALFHLRDAAARTSFVPVSATMTSAGNRLVLQSRNDPLDLRLTVGISTRGNFLQIDGELLAREPVDRCIDLKIALPFDIAGFVTGTGLFEGPPPSSSRKNAKKKAAATGDGGILRSAHRGGREAVLPAERAPPGFAAAVELMPFHGIPDGL